MGLAFFVTQDAYHIYTMNSESQLKVGYLKNSAFGTSSNLFAYKDLICFNAKQKRSTVKYCDRIEGLNLEIFTDSIEWENYIDAEDLIYFSEEITKVPVLLKDVELMTLRNKRTCVAILNYLNAKTSRFYGSGFGSSYVYKDDFTF